jgi:hypothetical protein
MAMIASISVPPWPPSFSGMVMPEQTLLGHQPGDIPGVFGFMRPCEGAVAQMALGEAAHGVAKSGLFGSQLEIHGRSS